MLSKFLSMKIIREEIFDICCVQSRLLTTFAPSSVVFPSRRPSPLAPRPESDRIVSACHKLIRECGDNGPFRNFMPSTTPIKPDIDSGRWRIAEMHGSTRPAISRCHSGPLSLDKMGRASSRRPRWRVLRPCGGRRLFQLSIQLSVEFSFFIGEYQEKLDPGWTY